MSRTTKSRLPAGGRLEEATEVGGGGSSSGSGGSDCARGTEEVVESGAMGVDGVEIGGLGVFGLEGATGGSEGIITAVITLSFVAAPGRAAPKPQALQYRMDLSSGQGSQDVAVFLGEVDYNDAGGAT